MDGLVVDHGEDDALDREEVVQAMVLKKKTRKLVSSTRYDW